MKELDPAVKAKMITYIRHLNYGTDDATELRAMLNFLNALTEVSQRIHQATGYEFDEAAVDALDRAAHRYAFIQAEIERAQMLIIDEIKHHEINKAELQAKGFSENEIAAIFPFPLEKINSIDMEINGLREQEAELSEIIAASPVLNKISFEGVDVDSIGERFTHSHPHPQPE